MFEDHLEAFGEAVEALALEGCGGHALRVRSAKRPPDATLVAGDGADAAVFAELLVPEIRARFEVMVAEARPGWKLGIEPIDSERFEKECLPDIHRTVAETPGLTEEVVAFASDQLTPGLTAISRSAPIFVVLSNHSMTCCGGAIYIIERPSHWLVIQLYAFC